MVRSSAGRLFLAAAAGCALFAALLTPRSARSPAPGRPSAASAPVPSRAGLVPWIDRGRPSSGHRGAAAAAPLAVRSLDDPAFGPNMAELGVYDPEAFLEAAPQLLYVLEPDLAYKTAVVFVHGLAGSARDFAPLVGSLDRARYKPWFFHYPSGMPLDQSAQLFYELLLAETAVGAPATAIIVVAHDLGGLVAREALNLRTGNAREAQVRLLVTLSSPFGGQRSTQREITEGAYVAAVWRDLEPGSSFLAQLLRRPLPAGTVHAAAYSYLTSTAAARGSAHDGVLPVSSQLESRAHAQFTRVAGFQTSHSGILRDASAIYWVLATIDELAGVFADEEAPAVASSGP